MEFRELSSLFLLILFMGSCNTIIKLETHDFIEPTDTTTRPIQMQQKKVFAPGEKGVFADNQFDGARLNDFTLTDQGRFQALIEPENSPINPSPWYAFRLWSEQPQSIELELLYAEGRHRYWPKLSGDGINWEPLDSLQFSKTKDTNRVRIRLNIGPDTLWVAGQEVINSTQVKNWAVKQAGLPDVQYKTLGKSTLGRELFYLDAFEEEAEGKDIIVILSRQHPPEVTGYFAMEAFVETLLTDELLANAFRSKYHLLIFPLMNPDGVDLGHWRHNAGGIDLNRDWAFYHQVEIKQVVEQLVEECVLNKSKIILMIDFHSTWRDIYYTNEDTQETLLPGFKDYWLQGIEKALTPYQPLDDPGAPRRPTSQSWFFKQFGAESITFEVGDATPRDFIREKGKIAALEMMELLVFKDPARTKK